METSLPWNRNLNPLPSLALNIPNCSGCEYQGKGYLVGNERFMLFPLPGNIRAARLNNSQDSFNSPYRLLNGTVSVQSDKRRVVTSQSSRQLLPIILSALPLVVAI